MTAALIDGGALAAKIKRALKSRVKTLTRKLGRPPSLTALAFLRDGSAEAYLRSQARACRDCGIAMRSAVQRGKSNTSAALRHLARAAADPAVDAIILQLPLPGGMDAGALIAAIPAGKDAEGISPLSYGRLFSCKSWAELVKSACAAPPTALAIAALIRQSGITVAGRRAVVVGRSSIVGRPAAHLLSLLDATVTLCHSRTKDLPGEVRRADIVVACAGVPRLIRGSWLKQGAMVIDAGVNQVGSSFVGDVHFEEARRRASWITPVPGGVGPATTAMLLSNVVSLAARRLGKG